MCKRTVATDKNNNKGECAYVCFSTLTLCVDTEFSQDLSVLSSAFFSLVLLSEPNILCKPSCKAGPE